MTEIQLTEIIYLIEDIRMGLRFIFGAICLGLGFFMTRAILG